MKELLTGLCVALVICVVAVLLINPLGVASWNTWIYHVRKADDTTNYTTRKEVENVCRALIVSYKSDGLKYEQYIASPDKEQRVWGEQAKMRANNTATQYNEYILKNRFVFKGNVPDDIKTELDYIR